MGNQFFEINKKWQKIKDDRIKFKDPIPSFFC